MRAQPQDSGILWQGPRSCQCLADVFRHLALEGESAPVLCFDTDTEGLRELLISGNGESMPPVKLVRSNISQNVSC